VGHHKKHIQKIKEELPKTKHLNEMEKSNTIKHLEEWIAEDKGEELFFEKLMEISTNIKPFLAEIGLV